MAAGDSNDDNGASKFGGGKHPALWGRHLGAGGLGMVDVGHSAVAEATAEAQVEHPNPVVAEAVTVAITSGPQVSYTAAIEEKMRRPVGTGGR